MNESVSPFNAEYARKTNAVSNTSMCRTSVTRLPTSRSSTTSATMRDCAAVALEERAPRGLAAADQVRDEPVIPSPTPIHAKARRK